jgi:hypothetical protein
MKKIIALLFLCYACGEPNNENKLSQQTATDIITTDSLRRFVVSSKNIPETEAKNKLSSIIKETEKDSAAFRKMNELLAKAFDDPNSSYRNENLYIQLLDAQKNSPWYIVEEKQAVDNKLKLAKQNRVGSPANDFAYYTPIGEKKTLYSIKAPLMLLYFYNPECHACMEMKTAIESSPIIMEKTHTGKLIFFAMYTDVDETLWKKHLPENPAYWINGRDKDEYLWKNRIYDLRAIPTMYLLDESKKVLLKDATIQQIEQALQ